MGLAAVPLAGFIKWPLYNPIHEAPSTERVKMSDAVQQTLRAAIKIQGKITCGIAAGRMSRRKENQEESTIPS